MNAIVRLAYARSRGRTLGQIEAELQEAEANLQRAKRGTFTEEYALARVQRLKSERARFPKGKSDAE